MAELFGFSIQKAKKDQGLSGKTFTDPTPDDGAIEIAGGGDPNVGGERRRDRGRTVGGRARDDLRAATVIPVDELATPPPGDLLGKSALAQV